MKRSPFLLTAFCAFLTICAYAQQTKLDFTSLMEKYRVPGMSISIIDNFKPVLAKGFGTLAGNNSDRVTEESVFEAASTTKLITTVIVMHYVEQGIFDLDEDVNKYLKSWKVPDNEFTRQQKVTLRLLLNHAAGLNVVESFSWLPGSKPTLAQVMNGESPALNQPAAMEYVPGRGGAYSNLGYILIQLILEDQLSKPFEQIARETIFEPVGMKSSTFAFPLTGDQQSREALPHDSNGKTCKAILHPTALAQGGLMTTPTDLALFANELMLAWQGRSKLIIAQPTVQMMFTPFMELSPEIFGFPAAAGTGVMIQGKGPDFSFFHPGENFPGATCWLVGIPHLGKAAVIMTNGSKGTALAMEVLETIRSEYKWPRMEAPAAPPSNPKNPAGENMPELLNTTLSESEKLFGLSEYWSEAKYNFVYFDRVPALNWDSLYKAYIPQVIETKSDYEYFKVMQRFAASLQDGHSLVLMPDSIVNLLDKPGILVKEFEKKMYVVNTDKNLKEKIPLGSEIVEINGIPIRQYLADSIFPYLSVSSKHALWDKAAENLLVGIYKSEVNITIQYKNDTPRKVNLIRDSKTVEWINPISAPNFFEYKILDKNIVYIALNSFFADSVQLFTEFTKIIPTIKESKGCIIDVRKNVGGDSWLGLNILEYFTDKNFVEIPSKTRKHIGDYKAKGAYELYLKGSTPYFDYATNNAWLNVGALTWQNTNKENIQVPLVVLTANETYSAGEDFVVYAKQLGKGATIIGEPTSGSSGQVLMFLLPGRALAGICAKRICFADGSTFIGSGITPDISINPSLEQYLNGQDVVLEKAISIIK